MFLVVLVWMCVGQLSVRPSDYSSEPTSMNYSQRSVSGQFDFGMLRITISIQDLNKFSIFRCWYF